MDANGLAIIATRSRVVLRRKSTRNLHLATPAMRHGAVVDNVHVILDRLILAEGGNLSWSAPNQNRPAEIRERDPPSDSLAIAAAKSGRSVCCGTLVKIH
jgi:hypothetical protein